MSRDGGTVLAALVDALERLPGIGARTARRLAEQTFDWKRIEVRVADLRRSVEGMSST